MNDPMTVDSFDHVLNAINAYLFSYMAPKDLFRLSCANKYCKKVVDEHLFEACRLQLETPVEPLGQIPSHEIRKGRCSVKFSRGRTFCTRAKLLDFVCAKWRPTDILLDHLRLENDQPDLTWKEALKELKTDYSRNFFDLNQPHISLTDGDSVLLRTDCDFIAKLQNDSSGINTGGRPSPLSLLLNSNEKEFIKDWANYFMATKNVTADCWRWEISQQYTLTSSIVRRYVGFCCVFSKREGGEELEVFADVVSLARFLPETDSVSRSLLMDYSPSSCVFSKQEGGEEVP